MKLKEPVYLIISEISRISEKYTDSKMRVLVFSARYSILFRPHIYLATYILDEDRIT
jgi:hypothetical protein